MKRFFLNKIWQAPNLYLTLRVLPTEFNSHKFSFVRFVFVEISGLLEWPPPQKKKKWPKKIAKISNFLQIIAIFVNFSIDVVDLIVEKVQQDKNSCPIVVNEEINEFFGKKKTKLTKNRKIPDF